METTNWKDRYDRMKRHYKWTDADIAEITGNTPGSTREIVRKETQFPRWARLAIVIFEKENAEQMEVPEGA